MSTLSRTRPGEDRWVDPKVFTKPTLKQGTFNWLGYKWTETSGKGKYDNPTV